MAQAPLTLRRWTRREYERLVDLGVVRGTWADYRDAHPTSAVLLVEVADSSLAFDRDRKGSLYARARVADYWIVNLVDRVLEIYRDPGPDPTGAYGWRYRSRLTLSPSETVAPLALPTVRLSVGELLP
jgi:hypothetical protein